MARRKSSARRRTKVRSVGTLLINPRKKRRTVKKRRASAKRRNPARKRRTSRRRPKSRVRRSKRRNPKVKGYRRRGYVKSLTRKKRRKSRRKTARRRNPSRSRRVRVISTRRKNPQFVQGIAAQAKKIPFIGGPLSKVIAFSPHMALAAIAVEAPIMGAKWIAQSEYVPQMIKDMGMPAYFAIIGAVLGLGVMYLAPGSSETKKRLAIAVSSGCAGAAYLLWKTPSGLDVESWGAVMLSGVGSYGAIAMGPDYGAIAMGPDTSALAGGPAYTVESGWGAVALSGTY